jgi:hypothetical protein
MCKAAGVPYFFLKGKPRKEAIVDRQLHQRPCADGLVCVLCTLGHRSRPTPTAIRP